MATAIALSLACSAALRAKPIDLSAASSNTEPISVDVVVVTGASLVPVISALSASEWFAHREQLRTDYPDAFQSFSLEILPGMTAGKTVMQRSSDAVFVFANYRQPGVHRLRLDGIKQPHIRFGANDMELVGRDSAR